MIKTHTCYTAACDVCEAEPPDSQESTPYHHVGESEALDGASYVDWWVGGGPDGKAVLCEKRDEAHLAMAREVAAMLGEKDLEIFQSFWPELFDENDQLLPIEARTEA